MSAEIACAQIDILHGFPGPLVSHPQAALVLGSDGNYYGSTIEGVASDQGTIFKTTPAGTVTTLHSFTLNVDGGLPYSALIQATDGSFYGTTLRGGNSDDGTLFKITS